MIEEAGSVKVFKSEYHNMVSSQPKIFWKPVVEFSIMAELTDSFCRRPCPGADRSGSDFPLESANLNPQPQQQH